MTGLQTGYLYRSRTAWLLHLKVWGLQRMLEGLVRQGGKSGAFERLGSEGCTECAKKVAEENETTCRVAVMVTL